MSVHCAQGNASRVLLILAAIALCSCGGGDGDAGGGNGGTTLSGPPAPAGAFVAGLWAITETSKTSSNALCQPPIDALSSTLVYVSQSGDDLTLMFSISPIDPTAGADGGVFTGTISAGAVSLSGSHPDDPFSNDGTVTLNPLSATVAESCDFLVGSASFTRVQTMPSALSCSGTIQFTGTRTVGSGCAGTIANVDIAEQGAPHSSDATAQAIALSSAISGSMPVSDETTLAAYDWYSLVVPVTTPVTMSLKGTAGQDVDLFLRASDGTTLIAISASPEPNESLSQNLAAGTYYIVVVPFDVTAPSNYTLVVQ
jgi:hypothetical protein